MTRTVPTTANLSSSSRRLGAYLLDGVLAVLTLGIGWLIWSLVVWKDGYTPAKKLLGMQVVRSETGQPSTWGGMFVREIIGKGIVGAVVIPITFGVLLFMLLWDSKRQQLWDKVAGTLVVDS